MKKALTRHIIAISVLSIISIGLIVFFSRYIDVTVFKPVVNVQNEQNNVVDNTESTDTNEPDADSSADTDITENTEKTESYILETTQDGETTYIEKIVFIGDKTTYALGRYTYTGIPNPIHQVWSVEQNVSPSKIMTVQNFIYPATTEATNYLTAIKDRSPAFVVLSFGSFDDGETLTKERLISSYTDFIVSIKQVSPNTQIIIQSIFPVSDTCEVISAAEVRERNEWLKELCTTMKVYYLDTWSALCDENGILLNIYATQDGYLLNEEGFRTVVNYVRTHVHPGYRKQN